MRIAIINIGTIVSGDWSATRPGRHHRLEHGRIETVGTASANDVEACDVVIDADGTTAIPGLIDSHVHITFGDYTPRQQTVGFLESYVHGGVTTAITRLRGARARTAAAIPKASRRWRSPRMKCFETTVRAACGSAPARSSWSPA